MDRYLDQQLGRLQTSQIGFYLVHGLTGELWNKLKQLGITEFLDAALADGRIGQAGFSFHDEPPCFKPIVDAYDWSFCQIDRKSTRLNSSHLGISYAVFCLK